MDEYYYTLEIKFQKDSKWTTEFGDEEFEVVAEEQSDSYPEDEIYAWRITGEPRKDVRHLKNV